MDKPDSETKVKWGDDCPVCRANKSIIAAVDQFQKPIYKCLKCKTVFPRR